MGVENHHKQRFGNFMIIENLRIEKDEQTARIIADIRIEDPKRTKYPETLWFRYPIKYFDYLTNSMNPFAAAVFLLAASLNEDLVVKGSLSPRLLWGMNEYLMTLHKWFPSVFNLIKIKPENFTENKDIVSNKVAASFSGGVDSFYTLLRYFPGQCDVMPISYAFFIHGFDIPLEDEESYEIAKDEYIKMMNDLDIELISVATNAKAFTRGLNWNNVFGTTIAGVAHSLEGLYQFYFLPSTQDNYMLSKEGTDPRLVPILATETTAIILDAGNISRPEKTEFIADKPITYENLRVCWEQIDGLNNCGRCEKCLRTMTELELAGKLSHYSAFKEPLTSKKIADIKIDKKLVENFWNDILQTAKSKGRNDIAQSIKIAIFKYNLSRLINLPILGRALKLFRRLAKRLRTKFSSKKYNLT